MPLPIGLRPMLARSTSAGWPPPCTGGAQCDVGARDGLAVQAVIEAAYRSAENGDGLSPAELLEAARA